jgi:hypothetical protein
MRPHPATSARPVTIEVLAYAPTEFFHCQHCEVVWDHIGLGGRIRADQRRGGQLPPDLAAEYAAISAWIARAAGRYGDRFRVRLIDAASLEGVWKALRHRIRRFPAFVIDGRHRIAGFDQERIEAQLSALLSA